MAAPHGLQRAIQRHQLATIGGRGVQKPLVDARVAAGIEQVDASGRPIAPRAAAHLIELDIAKGHMVEDHMTDVGDVHSLAKGGGGYDACEFTVAESGLDRGALGPCEPRMVKRDAGA
ncbi:Uncharacterised protein [Collinsella intestinalis]|nr:Uncharacterised protein [Collinsella intestinalis]